jgi:hypothetical protein
MPGTEIEDIFSGKASAIVKSKAVSSGVGGKSKTLKSGATQTTQTTTMGDEEGKKLQKRKKEKKRGAVASHKRGEKEVEGASNRETEEPATLPRERPKKRPRDEVEEVIDPSPSITVKKPRLETNKKSKSGGIKTGLDKFKDSRGSSGRRLLTFPGATN